MLFLHVCYESKPEYQEDPGSSSESPYTSIPPIRFTTSGEWCLLFFFSLRLSSNSNVDSVKIQESTYIGEKGTRDRLLPLPCISFQHSFCTFPYHKKRKSCCSYNLIYLSFQLLL